MADHKHETTTHESRAHAAATEKAAEKAEEKAAAAAEKAVEKAAEKTVEAAEKAATAAEKATEKAAEKAKADKLAKEHKAGVKVRVGGKVGKVAKVVGHDPEGGPGGAQATYAVVLDDGTVVHALESQVEAVEK